MSNKNDKSMPKICLGFNLSLTIFIFIFAILFLHPMHYYSCVFWGLLDVIYFVFLIKYSNPLWQIPLTVAGMLGLTLKSFFAYIIISQYEMIKTQTPMFTYLHALVLLFAIGLVAYLWSKFYQTYIILKNNTITRAQEKIILKNKMPKWVAIVSSLSGSPMVLVRLFRDDLSMAGLSMGFFMWILFILFVIILAMLIPKLFVLIRFKAWKFVK